MTYMVSQLLGWCFIVRAKIVLTMCCACCLSVGSGFETLCAALSLFLAAKLLCQSKDVIQISSGTYPKFMQNLSGQKVVSKCCPKLIRHVCKHCPSKNIIQTLSETCPNCTQNLSGQMCSKLLDKTHEKCMQILSGML